MARGEGPGWHHESRRHSEVAKKGRPTHAKVTRPKRKAKVNSPDANYQRTYAQAFQDFERKDLANNEAILQDIYDNDPDNDEQIALIDLIWEGRARIELAEIMKGLADRGLTNEQYVAALRKYQDKASHEAEGLWEKQSDMEDEQVPYDENNLNAWEMKRHKLEWQAQAINWITENISSGKPYEAG